MTPGATVEIVDPDPNPDPASKSGDPFQPPNPDDFAPPAICGETHLGIHGTIGDEPYDKAAGSVGASFSEHGYVDSMVSGGVFMLGGDSYVLGAAENVGETAWRLDNPELKNIVGTQEQDSQGRNLYEFLDRAGVTRFLPNRRRCMA